ncbi:LysR family transcriptional regulator [Streptomyces orinoci]|uniref:LysR family transcriptional regulator n=1 Tax=Streptomyces orinoci TaxID=67339 RepID=A0ABV3JXE9_STRON|nr:LysR family transcriptional regulator [Streptomyces orinoci]
MDVELRHLRALVAIAEEGTITAAAETLRLTQPALSRTLAQLEQRVGVRLLDRSGRRPALTPAGRTLSEHGRVILARVQAAVADAAAVDRPLRLGYSCSVLGRFTVPLLRSWRREHPQTPLELRRHDTGAAGLATGEVDVAVLRRPVADAGLWVEELYWEERFAALPDNHPLACRPSVTLDQLASGTLALCPGLSTVHLDLWPPAARPAHTVEVRDVDEWLTVIATGDVFGVAAAGTCESHPHPGVRYVPVADAPATTVYLARPAHPTHPRTGDLLALARQLTAG